MVKINAEGMNVADLDSNQMEELLVAEKKMNKNRKGQEVYLLAVIR